jgi:hypothetical protein
VYCFIGLETNQLLGDQGGHLLGEDFAEQGLQLAVGAFGLLLGAASPMGVVIGHQVDLDCVIAGFPERGNLQDRRAAEASVGEQDVLAKAGGRCSSPGSPPRCRSARCRVP